jgi:DNA-binding response OmpR family regulator
MDNQKSTRTKRTLLVDDEPDICMVYQIVLEHAGYQCTSYTDPIIALKGFRPNCYNLVMLDIKMPILDGFALCEKIRELDKTVHIIFITAAEESYYHERLKTQSYPELTNHGDIKYIQKPIENEELVNILNITIAAKHTSEVIS